MKPWNERKIMNAKNVFLLPFLPFWPKLNLVSWPAASSTASITLVSAPFRSISPKMTLAYSHKQGDTRVSASVPRLFLKCKWRDTEMIRVYIARSFPLLLTMDLFSFSLHTASEQGTLSRNRCKKLKRQEMPKKVDFCQECWHFWTFVWFPRRPVYRRLPKRSRICHP